MAKFLKENTIYKHNLREHDDLRLNKNIYLTIYLSMLVCFTNIPLFTRICIYSNGWDVNIFIYIIIKLGNIIEELVSDSVCVNISLADIGTWYTELRTYFSHFYEIKVVGKGHQIHTRTHIQTYTHAQIPVIFSGWYIKKMDSGSSPLGKNCFLGNKFGFISWHLRHLEILIPADPSSIWHRALGIVASRNTYISNLTCVTCKNQRVW